MRLLSAVFDENKGSDVIQAHSGFYHDLFLAILLCWEKEHYKEYALGTMCLLSHIYLLKMEKIIKLFYRWFIVVRNANNSVRYCDPKKMWLPNEKTLLLDL